MHFSSSSRRSKASKRPREDEHEERPEATRRRFEESGINELRTNRRNQQWKNKPIRMSSSSLARRVRLLLPDSKGPTKYSCAISEIWKVFGQDLFLNESFLTFSDKAPNIDFKQLDDFYSIVENDDVLLSSIFAMAMATFATSEGVKGDTDLRKFLILLEYPFKPDIRFLFKPFAQAFVELSQCHKNTLTKWISKYEPWRLKRLIDRINMMIDALCPKEEIQSGGSSRSLRDVVELMHLIFNAVTSPYRVGLFPQNSNGETQIDADEKIVQGNDSTTPNTPLEIFYSRGEPPVTENVFFNKHLSNVLRVPNEMENNDLEDFCFFRFQWVWNTMGKIRILRDFASGNLPFELRLPLSLKVHRENLIEDAFNSLETARIQQEDEQSSVYLTRPLKIAFEGEHGLDEGGPKVEFFRLMTEKLFSAGHGLFKMNAISGTCWFSRNEMRRRIDDYRDYEQVGIVLGLALKNSMHLDLRLPLYFYQKLLGYHTTQKDIDEVIPEFSASFQNLLCDSRENIDSLSLTFSVDKDYVDGKNDVELKMGGMKTLVSKDNIQEYVQLFTKFLLDDSIEKQFVALTRGFVRVMGLDIDLLKMFQPHELKLAFCGRDDLDFNALEKAAKYSGYSPESATVKNLWKVLKSLSTAKKKLFLKFCTGTDRAPIEGLSCVTLTISKQGGTFPRAHTCHNQLMLPDYKSEQNLKAKLLIAIEYCEGFGTL